MSTILGEVQDNPIQLIVTSLGFFANIGVLTENFIMRFWN